MTSARLPTLQIEAFGVKVRALLDSGCSRSIISPAVAKHGRVEQVNNAIVMINRNKAECTSICNVKFGIHGRHLTLECLVTNLLPQYEVLLGMDVIAAMGGVTRGGSGRAEFGEPDSVSCIAKPEGKSELVVHDDDFSAVWSAEDGAWTVEWEWREGISEPVLRNEVAQYRVSDEVSPSFEDEVEEWIRKGWLQPYEGNYSGLLPLMAVVQRNKQKVRPVLDYRELNTFVSSHTGASEVCAEKLRKWRRMGVNVKIVDLRKAYLQVHISKKMWKFQVVKFKGKVYCLTRLGFGLNVAPKIMTSIVSKVLSMDEDVKAGTDSYIDDIFVNEDVVSSQRVMEVLKRYGLSAKPAEPLIGGRVLGLRIKKEGARHLWVRDNVLDEALDGITKRQAFGLCGQMIGHFPVAGWLRPACSYLKRLMNERDWDEEIKGEVLEKLKEVKREVDLQDPVSGQWDVPSVVEGRIWCDASSLAVGVCLEIGGDIVEDNSWLRKPNDAAHINLAELEAVIKGLNLAVKWELTRVEIMTDSATVFAWISSVLTQDRRIRTKGLGEILERRRIGLIEDIIAECGIDAAIKLVKSVENKADALTRVPRKWLQRREEIGAVTVNETERQEKIKRLHDRHHLGVDRSLYVAQRSAPNEGITRREIELAVKSCVECLSIDPSPVRWPVGELDVDKTWYRVACDVTHYGHSKFCTMVDCGPSRFAIWRFIRDEGVENIVRALSEVFSERGPPVQLLLDNSRSFRSEAIGHLCHEWNVELVFRCINRPSGNGIIERNHRTIKRMSERTGRSVSEMVYWYNFTPRVACEASTAPWHLMRDYEWRSLLGDGERETKQGVEPDFRIGELVFVKPQGARCTTKWRQGKVTALRSAQSIEVDGVPLHVGDVRRWPSTREKASVEEEALHEDFPRNVLEEEERGPEQISLQR